MLNYAENDKIDMMKKLLSIAVMILFPLVIQAQSIERFVNTQLQSYPKSRLLDIYKSCFIFENEIRPIIEKGLITEPKGLGRN